MANFITENFGRLMGFGTKASDPVPQNLSVVPKVKDDGAIIVAGGGSYGMYVDLDGGVRNEGELITKYREMSNYSEVERAVQDIVNEAIVVDDDEIVRIILDKLDCNDNVKERIRAEFQIVLDLLGFEETAYELFRKWYIDGRLNFQAIINKQKPEEGIKEVRYMDGRKLRKVRETVQVPDVGTGIPLQKITDEYYVYNESGFSQANSGGIGTATGGAAVGVKLTPDSVISITSGLMDPHNSMVLSYLHPAIRIFNIVKSLEDATVIYRVSRAPDRRVFYIDVGDMGNAKAEQYVRDIMVKHKNKVVFDSATGEVRDDRKFATMTEDYFLPRREGSKGTEITNLEGLKNVGGMEELSHFMRKLYESLQVPFSRLEPDKGTTLGRTSEISRDEIKFGKFIKRLRKRFSHLFLEILKRQLILKGVCNESDWAVMSRKIRFEYEEDNHFSELKDIEIMMARSEAIAGMSMLVGRYISHETVRKKILRQSDEEIEEEDKKIADERDNQQYQLPMGIDGGEDLGMMGLGNDTPPAFDKDPSKIGPGGGQDDDTTDETGYKKKSQNTSVVITGKQG